MNKVRVAIICGGKSSEHEISCISANGILDATDRSKFEPVLIGITKSGKWLLLPEDTRFIIQNGALPTVPESGLEVSITSQGLFSGGKNLAIDIAFPILLSRIRNLRSFLKPNPRMNVPSPRQHEVQLG